MAQDRKSTLRGARRSHPLARLVRGARGSVSQEKFATELSISQELLSRYERGQVEPSVAVLERCWEILEERSTRAPPAADVLVRRIKEVSGPEFTGVREAIARIIEVSVGKKPAGRPPS